MVYVPFDAYFRVPRQGRDERQAGASYEDIAMTLEILHLTAQIQRWLNRRIARHLAEQAERLAR
jgi:hypothetical protein